MKKAVLGLVLCAFLLTGCATVYSPLGVFVKSEAPLEVVVYGHRVDRNPANGWVQAIQTVATAAGTGAALLTNGLSSAGFTAITTASIILDRQNRDRYIARIRADKDLVGHILAIIVLPDKETAQARIMVLTDLDPGNPQVKLGLTQVLKESANVETSVAQ